MLRRVKTETKIARRKSRLDSVIFSLEKRDGNTIAMIDAAGDVDYPAGDRWHRCS